MNPWITNFLLLVISIHKSRVGARKARQWACPRFISVVCGGPGVKIQSHIACQKNRYLSTKRFPASSCLYRAKILRLVAGIFRLGNCPSFGTSIGFLHLSLRITVHLATLPRTQFPPRCLSSVVYIPSTSQPEQANTKNVSWSQNVAKDLFDICVVCERRPRHAVILDPYLQTRR
jgi:hypothetical protein